MTKSIWKYYAKKLYKISQDESFGKLWQINNIVAMDLVTHGESAMLNMGKLGYEYDWRDGGRDLVKMAAELDFEGDNVAIGHSMGGFQVIYAASLAPTLFKFVVPIEAVMNQDGDVERRFNSRLSAINRALITDFKNEEYEKYMRNFSFYKAFNKEILDDLIKAEKMINKEGTCSAKTNKHQQMLGYYGGFFSFPIALDLVSGIEIPIVHVTGGSATWNEKESVEVLRKQVKFLDAHEIKGGQHLVNGEQPDDVIDLLVKSFDKYLTDDESTFKNRSPLSLEKYKEAFMKGYKPIEQAHFIKKKPSKL